VDVSNARQPGATAVPPAPCGALQQSPGNLRLASAGSFEVGARLRSGDFARAAIWITASGRRLKITPTTPSGTLTRCEDQAQVEYRWCSMAAARADRPGAATVRSPAIGRPRVCACYPASSRPSNASRQLVVLGGLKISPVGGHDRASASFSRAPAMAVPAPCLPLGCSLVWARGHFAALTPTGGWPVARTIGARSGTDPGTDREWIQNRRAYHHPADRGGRFRRPAGRPHCPGHSAGSGGRWRLSGSTRFLHFTPEGRQKVVAGGAEATAEQDPVPGGNVDQGTDPHSQAGPHKFRPDGQGFAPNRIGAGRQKFAGIKRG